MKRLQLTLLGLNCPALLLQPPLLLRLSLRLMTWLRLWLCSALSRSSQSVARALPAPGPSHPPT